MNMIKPIERLLLWFPICLLSACATTPTELQAPDVEPLTLSQVSQNPEVYRGRRVRWGGTILAVENEADATWVQILGKPLDSSWRPKEDARPLGRFLVSTEAFLDPAIYTQGRELTVLGTLDDVAERTVGKREIQLPVVRIESWRLWPKRVEIQTPYYYPYWWYSPPYYRYWPGYYW
ncbi:MAG: Slp family lipoprotein [Methylohalobius sp. ZOD2]